MATTPNIPTTPTAAKVGSMKNLAALDVLRRDIAKVNVVDTDFVVQMKSGRKILIRDGALRSATEEDFKVVFSDNEVVSGKEFFGEAQNLPGGNLDANWADTAITDIPAAEVSTAALVAPVVGASGSYTTVGIVGGLLAAAGGGGGGSSGDNNAGQVAALKTIADFARENTASRPTPVGSFQYKAGIAIPTVKTYTDAKVTGVTDSNIESINDALATSSVTDTSVNTAEKLQTVVNAYNQIISLANGAVNTDILPPTLTEYQLIGVTGLDASTTQAAKLLSSVIDLKRYADIDTVNEIQALANITNRVIAAAGGNATLTTADLEALGLNLTGVLDFTKVISAIVGTNDNGTGVDSFEELQTLIDGVVGTAATALQSIVDFAQANTNSAPTPPVVGVLVPVTTTYKTAGVTGVSDSNVSAINDALMTANVNGDSVNTLVKLQNLVDAYNSLLALADGVGNNATSTQTLSVTQLITIGADTAELLGANPSNRIDLLKSIIDGQKFTGVDTVKEINALIKIANAIQDTAQGLTPTHTLTADELVNGGVAGVTTHNLDGFIKAIENATTHNANSILKLQDLLYKNLSLSFTAINQDTGFDTHDFITTDTLLDFSGDSNAADGTKIRITLTLTGHSDIVLEGVVNNGKWSVSNTNNANQILGNGIYSVKAELLDAQDRSVRTQVFAQTVTIDTSADQLPDGSPDPALVGKTIAFTGITPDTGELNDFRTSNTRLKFNGTSTASAGTHVGLVVDGALLSNPTLTWEDTGTGINKWQIDYTGQDLSAGKHSVEVFLMDAAGNKLIGSSSAHDVVIDTAGLTLVSKTFGAIAASANLVLTFSTAVKAQDGKYIHITDESTGSVISVQVTDTQQVTISNPNSTYGTTVTINLSNDLVAPNNYHATIDNGAFVTSAGVFYDGLSYSQSANDWRFQAVDPSTTVVVSGSNVDASNGLNAAELAVVNISGTVSGASLSSVTNAKISKLVFTASDGSSFEVTQGLPGAIDLNGTKTWTLANDPSWTNQLRTGTTYTVRAQLDSVVSGVAQTTYASSASVAIDRVAPLLTSIVCDEKNKTSFKSGDSSVFTLTFNEDPGSSLKPEEIAVTTVGGKAIGTITALYGTGNTRKVLFSAAENTNFTPTDSNPIFKVINGTFSDAVGNLGSVAGDVLTPSLRVDTNAPVINSITISGLQKNGTEISSGTLIEGEKIRVTVHMSEATTVVGTPTFNIVVGSAVKQASYVTSSGNDLLFEYTIVLGDADNTGGITASAIGLLTTSSRITDLVGNDADLRTASVPVDNNTLAVVTTGANDAMSRIIAFAELNSDPNNVQSTTPSIDDYAQAGIKNVNSTNVNAINNSLATAVINGARVADVQSLQNLVTAFNKILDLANGKDDVTHNQQPDYLQYSLIGVQGVDSTQASLLGDVIDLKTREDVDTVSEIQDLANAAAAVMNLTKKVNGLTAEQLTNKLGITKVTDDNFAAVARAIANTSPTGSDVDTLENLQKVVETAVNKAVAALNALQIFAEANQNSLSASTTTYIGVKPTWSTLYDAGINSVAGVADSKLADMVTDALATNAVKAVNVSTSALVQGVVNAYGAIAQLANSQGETPLDAQPKAVTYKLIGVSGFDNTDLPSSIHKAKLLSDVIDRKALVDLDTVLEIQALADAASAVLANAAGNGTASVAQFKLLGLDVPADKLADVTTAITGTADDGSEVDTFLALSTIITSKLGAVDQAVRLIASFADQNTVSQPTPSGSYQGVAPTAQTYIAAGVSGPVSDAEAQAFNDALATSLATYNSVDTAQEIKDLAAAYRAVLNLADDAKTTVGSQPTAFQYHLLGVTGFDPSDLVAASNSTNRASLLGDVIDRKVTADVNTVLEIQALANSVAQVMNMANGVDGLTLGALTQLGIAGVTADNLAAVKHAIDRTLDDGSGVNTFSKLQNVVTEKVNHFNTSLGVIQQYAKTHADPSLLGTDQPTVQNYLDLGISSVTPINLEAINSALATSLVTDAEVNTAQAVSAVVNAYADIFKAANGVYNPGTTISANDYSLLGISGVGSSAVKLKLLSDVIDRQSEGGVNTTVKLQALADKVSAVMNTAAKAATGGITQAHQLLDLGLQGVTPINLSQVIAAIQKTNSDGTGDGTGVDTVEELQSIVNSVLGTQTTSMNVLIAFANANTVSKPLTGSFSYQTGVTVPTEQHYMDAGIIGNVSPGEAQSLNDALATSAITGISISDVSKLQVVVDAYRKVLALADGQSNLTTDSSLQLLDLQRLGTDTTALNSLTGEPLATRLRLLNDSIDRKNPADVDTIAEINQLIKITNAIQDQAAGIASSYTLTAIDFATVGIEGVTASNLAAYLVSIKTAGPAGADSLNELQTVLSGSLSVALTAISEDRGVSATDFITSDNTLTYSGTSSAADGSIVKLILKKNAVTIAELNATVIAGVWQSTDTVARDDGVYTVDVQLFNSKNVPVKTGAQGHVTIDSDFNKNPDGSTDTSLAGKTIDFNLTADTDSGTPNDYKTSNTRLKFIGTSNAADGTHVALSIDGVVTYSTVTGGTWNVNYTDTSLGAGPHTVIASLVDASGNPAAAGTPGTVQHDVTIDASALTLVSKTNGAVASIAPLELTFSDSVTAQANKSIKIIDDSNNTVIDTISVTDATRVTITGNVVRIALQNDLTPGKNYHVTLDANAFASSTGALSTGLALVDDWRLNPADPTTSISFTGVGVTTNDGINATEFATLTVSGTVSSARISAVKNIAISKIIFTNTDDGSTFIETNGISLVDPTTFQWTLARQSSWTSQLVSGKHYTVSAVVVGDINNITATSTSVSSPTSLVDTVTPVLLGVTVDKTNLKIGETATYTLTFSEDPGNTLSADDFVISTDANNVLMGTVKGISGTGFTRIVFFEPTANITNTGVALQLNANSFADAVNNTGIIDASVNWPTLAIDTIAPFVTGITISGVNGLTNAAIQSTDTMVVGDIIQVSLDMSEAVIVSDVPTFNIDVGGVSKAASFNRAKSTSTKLVFTYTVAPGDVDTNGGITADSNSLTVSAVARIVDTAGNAIDPTTQAVLPGNNTLHFSTTQDDPFTTIKNFAQNNSNPDPTTWVGPVPTVNHYAQARVIGVDTFNVDAINNALSTPYLNAIDVDELIKLQHVVEAYNTILNLADGQETVPTLNNPSYAMYGLIGVQGVDSDKGNLLTDVIDLKNKTDVDTVPEIQALADAVTAVKNAAQNGTSMSQAQLEKLGIKDLTADNFDVALRAIVNTHDFFKVDTLDELKDVISSAISSYNSALTAIKLYALNNSGIAPTTQQYINAGITGVSDNNLASINSALATATVTDVSVSHPVQIQSLVNAYNKVIQAADGKNNIANTDNMPAAQYALIGVTGVDSDVKKSLLGDVIDLQPPTGVDTANKVQALADAVTAVMNVAKGNTTALTQAQLQSLGVDLSGVTDFSKVITAIDGTNDDGSGVATLEDLQLLINNVIGSANTALQVIVKFADVNKASSPASPEAGTTVPDVATYDAANVIGVNQNNVAAINDALMTLAVDGASVGTTAKLQAIIDTYKTVLALADGTANNATVTQTFTVAQLTGMGVDTTGMVGSSNDTTRLNLLKNIIDGQKTTGVDTINEINQLIKITNAIQDQAIGKASAYTLTVADFVTLGVEGVSTSNLNAYLTNIQTAGSEGADSLSKLQTLLNDSLTLVFTAITPDTGIDSADFITKENTGLILSGTSNAVDGSKVKITLTTPSAGPITLDATVIGGVWQTASQPKFNDGVYTVSAALLNSKNNPIRTVAQSSFSIDTSANGADDVGIAGKTINFTTITPDAGILNDYKTNTGFVILSGTSTAANGANVALSVDGTLYYTTVQNGAWSVDYNLRPLSAAVHKVQVSLIDKAGNVAASSVMRDVEISTSSLTLDNKTTGSVAKASNLVLTFSDNVVARAGKNIQIIDETTGQPMETILVTDTSRVTIEGKRVTINPTADLTLGKTYHATIDSEAFETVAGTKYAGLAGTDWSFRPVDPTTSVNFGGTNVITGGGINASEINNLTISGTVTSSNIIALNNLKITKLSFTSTNGGTSFDIATIDLPTINTTNYGWTLAPDVSWQSKLTSGKNYTVTAQVEGDIGTTHTSTTVSSASILIDTEAPQLTITGNKTVVKVGESITYTFTFTDVPLDFAIGDIVVNTVSNTPLGTVSNFTATADAKVYTVVFTPTVVVNQLSISPISVLPSSYTDSTGNFGSAVATAPVVLIDTLAPGNVSFNTTQGASQPADAAYFNKNDTNNASGKVIAPNINKPIDADISTITVVVGGADLAFDSLLFGPITQALNLSNNGSNITVGGVTDISWSWNYNASTSTGTLTLQKTATGTITADNVNAIERDLRFKTNTSPSQTPRTFTFTHTDGVGNVSGSGTQTINVDTIVLANDWNSTLAGTQQTDTSFFNKANLATSKNILPALAVAIAENDIVNLKIDASSATVVSGDQLLFGSVVHNFSTSAPNGTTSISGLTIDWAMTASRVLTITKNGGGAFSAAEVNAIQADLRFQTTSTSQTARVIGFSRTDLAGNVSTVSTVTLNIDTLAPQDIDLTSTSAGIDKTLTRPFAAKDILNGILIAPNVVAATTAETDIASIRIAMSGTIDSTTDSIALGGKTFFLINTLQSSSNVAIANVSGGVELVFDSNNVLTITKTSGGSFNTSEVVVIEKLLQFKTSSTTVADRTATFTHTDQAGNKSADSVVTLKVDTVAPSPPDIDGSTTVIDTLNNVTYKLQQPITGLYYGFALAPKMALPVDTDITGIQLVGTNLQADTDAIVFTGRTFGFSISYANSFVSILGISVVVSQSGGTMVFTKSGGGAFLPTEVQTVAKSLTFGMASPPFQTTTKQGSRSFAISYLDFFGNASQSVTANVLVDTLIPLDVDLRSDQSGTQVTDQSYFNRSNLIVGNKVIAPNIAATTDSDISTINLMASGINVPPTFQFILGGFQLLLSYAPATASGTTVYNNLSLAWNYSSRTLSLSKTSGGVFTAAEILSIEQGMSFSPNAATPSQGSHDFFISHVDAAGNIGNTSKETVTIDTVAPVVNMANTLTIANNSGSTAILLKGATATVTESNTLQSVQIKAKNLRDGSNEKLIIGGIEIDASGTTASSGTVSLTGATWNWTYNATGVFTFALNSGLASAATAAALLQSISYRNGAGAAATDDARQFVVTTTDVAGNTSAESAATVVISAFKPSLASSNSVVLLDANNDGVKGDQFVIRFGELVKASNLSTTSAWVLSSGTWGANASITAIDTITINGNDYATSFWVKTGTADLINSNPGPTGYIHITVPDQYYLLMSLNYTLVGMTLETWLKIDTLVGAVDSPIFGLLNNTNSKKLLLTYNADGTLSLKALFNDPGTLYTSYSYKTTNLLSTNTWLHVATTIDTAGASSIFINGVQVAASVAGTFTNTYANANWEYNMVGGATGVPTTKTGFSLADYRIYNGVRSSTQIISDMQGDINFTDPNLKQRFSFNNTLNNDVVSTGGKANLFGASSNPIPNFEVNAVTLTAASTNVIDATGSTATANQVITLVNNTSTSGTKNNETISGGAGNDFIAGHGGNDALTGGTGADTFAWLLGETGSDTVNDFKVSDGDMINLSGLLQNAGLGPNSPDTNLSKYMQLAQSGNHAVLTVDPTGGGNFLATNTSLKTITFTNGWTTGGLNDTLLKLVANKVINLNYLNATPLMLDLNGDGVYTTSVDQGVAFDIEGNGQVVQTAWSDGKDGFLVLDVNHDGTINSGRELFGNGTLLANGSKARDGFEALTQYDGNQDGVMDANDAVFANLKVWVDANHDGVSTANELHTLNALGIQNIQLGATASQLIDNGNPFSLVSHWTDTSDQQHAVVDALLTTSIQLKHDVVI